MKIEEDQFDAIAYLFEKHNGNSLGEFENNRIEESEFKDTAVSELVKAIIDNLNDDRTADSKYRTLAYWALSKRFDIKLLTFFQDSLKRELAEPDTPAVFQLLIALDNLEEPVFGKDRDGSFSGHDIALNIRDAKNYLAEQPNR
jgi:hypothetical protein